MNADGERSRSVWLDTQYPPASALRTSLRTDVLVIGAGIAGLSIAYELARAGRGVTVVDRGKIGGGMTARTSGHLSYEIDDTYAQLIETLGEREAKNYFDSQKAAVDRIEEICTAEKIACDFARLDLFVFAPDKKGRDKLEKEIEAAGRLGFKDVAWAEAPVAVETRGCLRFPNQARFHVLQYLAGLVRAIKRLGGTIHANTTVVSVSDTKTGAVAETASGHKIRARAVVAATNSPFVNHLAIHKKQAAYRTYVIALEMPPAMNFDALMWDTDDPYHYVRACRSKGTNLLIAGGEDHPTGRFDDGAERLKRIEAWTRRHFPEAGKQRYAWSGQVYEPVDYTPFVGRNPGYRNVFLVTGDSGEGLTTGVASSLLLPDLIAGRKNPWTRVYSPSRKAPRPPPVKHAKGKAKQAKPAATKAKDIRAGAGAIVADGEEMFAIYRDPKGRLHRRAAACTHVGCTVQWNSFERCWDCPCHGSHFAALGEAIQCPAVMPLAKAGAES